MEHIKGVNNHLADAISCLLHLQNSSGEMEQEERELVNLEILIILQEGDSDDTLTPEEYLEVAGLQHIL